VKQYHGENTAAKALMDYGNINKQGLPEFKIEDLQSINAGRIHIIDLLLELFQLKGRSECRRFIEPGSVKIDGEKVMDGDAVIEVVPEMIIHLGKKRVIKLI
jgi:tyrosyl-tRNA synthetase